ncbi:MAG: biotin--[acetyl-CoA-carboxylase] ligase [Pseudomonadota bacterium]
MSQLSSGAALTVFDEIASTNQEAKKRIEEGARGPEWVLARRQTQGYGRRGRAWEQATGDFSATLLLTPSAPVSRFGELAFVVALAVGAAIEVETAPRAVTLKWPNDVLVEGAKAAGILIETAQHADGVSLAIGIGVNIISVPDDVAYPATCISSPDAPPISPEVLLKRIDSHLFAYLKRWERDGFAPIRSAWMERAAGIGEPATVNLPAESLEGVIEGIDEHGALLLRLGDETRIIAAADVFFGAP